MSNDKFFRLVVQLQSGERQYFEVNQTQADNAKNYWKYPHGENLVIQHMGGDYCIVHKLIQSIQIAPTDEDIFEARLRICVNTNPELALQKSIEAMVRKNLDPFKEGLSSLDKRVDYFVGQLEAKSTPKSQPKDDRALCKLPYEDPRFAIAEQAAKKLKLSEEDKAKYVQNLLNTPNTPLASESFKSEKERLEEIKRAS